MVRYGGSHVVQETDRLFDLFGQHYAIYMYYSEHLEPVYGGAEVGALGSNKACSLVFEGHIGVWFEIYWIWRSEVAGVYKLILGRE